MIVCQRCGRESPENVRFCAGCGAPLAPSATREERKVVTVLFAELVGSTSRAEALWRSMGATAYAAECESLLAATA